jgi:putative inorganic carbon (HCO3(-)) transporter
MAEPMSHLLSEGHRARVEPRSAGLAWAAGNLTEILALTFASLFLLTALVGVWAAYDRAPAWRRLVMIAIGLALAVGVAWAGRRRGRRALGTIGLGCALLAGALGAYFLLSHDWTAGPGKFAALQGAGLWVQAHRPQVPLPEDIHPNIAAGGLALTLPLGAGGVVWTWSQGRRPLALVGALGLTLGLIALALSASRGAWLGLGAGALTAGYLEWRFGYGRSSPLRLVGDVLLIEAALVALAAFGVALSGPSLDRWLGTIPMGDSAIGRAQLWRDSLGLIGDYPFTGSGLGATSMVYSSYVLLIHVPFAYHMHNLFLQIAVEQGVPGLVAFLGLVGVAGWKLIRAYRGDGSSGALRLAATTAFVTLLVNGMVDAGVYGSRLVLIGFLPLGFAVAFVRRRRNISPASDAAASTARARRRTVLWLLPLVLVLAALLLPGSRAAFQANLGAVAQTQAELSIYHWPEWSFQDAVRRSSGVDLAPAVTHYQAALVLNQRNATAQRLLGQITLSLGDYETARQHLEAAYAAAPNQRATRQLLGESYAIEGEVERAAALWRTVDTGLDQLAMREMWYNSIGEPERAAWVAEAAALAASDAQMDAYRLSEPRTQPAAGSVAGAGVCWACWIAEGAK